MIGFREIIGALRNLIEREASGSEELYHCSLNPSMLQFGKIKKKK